MKNFLTLLILTFIYSLSFAQQRKGFNEWDKAAQTDIRMLPMYGHQQKTKEQIQADDDFLKTVLEQDKTKKAGSEHLIKLGFTYAYQGNLQTAMSRFNQAWLLDSTNANVFWGFGGVYFYLQAFDETIKMYNLGLVIDSTNTNLLTDLGNIYLTKYDDSKPDKELLAQANSYLEKSYQLNPKYSSTVYKLIISSLYSGDCEKAKKYFKECEKLERNPITDVFRNNFKEKCK